MADFDRSLTVDGLAAARALGKCLAEQRLVPESVICSPAKRTRETWDAVAAELAKPPSVAFLDALYSADSATYLDIIRQHGGDNSTMVVGHNPMMEDLAIALSAEGDEANLAALRGGFPACGLAVIAFNAPLSNIEPSSGRLERFLVPQA